MRKRKKVNFKKPKRSKIEGGEFSVAGGYVFYDRLKEDINFTRFLGINPSEAAITTFSEQQEKYRSHTWNIVADQLMATGAAEQEKERRLLSVLSNGGYDEEIPYNEYPKYIEAINQLIGLKDKYKSYLEEVKAQAQDDHNQRAAGGFRYFESRIATEISQGIKETMGTLPIQKLMAMSYDQISEYVENSISNSIERAMEKVANQGTPYTQKKIKIWKEISDGFKNLNSENKNQLISTIYERYKLNDLSSKITEWLLQNFKNPKRKKDLMWGLTSAIKRKMDVGEKAGSSIDGFLSEFIPSLLNTSLGSGMVLKSNAFKTDSIELFNLSIDADTSSIFQNFSALGTGNEDSLINQLDRFTADILNKVEKVFIVYDSSKMYRLSGSFTSRGFGGTSGNLENLGQAISQFGISSLNENIAHTLYQTIKGAILQGQRDVLIEQVKREIIRCITTAFFDDISFQGPTSSGDNVIHMLTLEGIRIPLSFYCFALANAISKAAEEITSDNLKKYVSISITLPKEIMFPDKEKVIGFEGKKFPSSIYAAWNAQRAAAISESHFEIHFLRNFEQIIDSLISGNLTI